MTILKDSIKELLLSGPPLKLREIVAEINVTGFATQNQVKEELGNLIEAGAVCRTDSFTYRLIE